MRDLNLCHIVNLDAMAHGEATFELLRDWVAAVLLWSRVAEQLQRGVDEITAQLELTHDVIQRYRRTGRVAFDGAGYQLAKTGLNVMDQLALIVDRPTAIEAAEWSEAKILEIFADVQLARLQHEGVAV